MPASTLQHARLRTLALTRDITRGQALTLRSDRKLILLRVEKKLDQEKAARIIAAWEAAPMLPLAAEQTPVYLGMYTAQKKSFRKLYKLSTV